MYFNVLTSIQSFKTKFALTIDVVSKISYTTGRPIICVVPVIHITITINSVDLAWTNIAWSPIKTIAVFAIVVDA